MRIPVITGPTAVGKTAISLDLAERYGCEIISADSRQVYRELTIGTAKPSRSDLSRIKHHFVDERALHEPFSAGIFASEAWERIGQVLERGRCPLVVGGSTLYLTALQEGLADIPPVPEEVRASLQARLGAEGAEALHAELTRVDPESARRIPASKTQRLVRALEVFLGTGVPLSAHQASHHPPPYRFRTVVLSRDRQELYARINRRTEEMLEEGLIDEVKAILDAGYSPQLPALQTIGYREIIQYLNGEVSLDQAGTLVARNTRRYAKRQLTWFRRYAAYAWLPASAPASDLANELFPGQRTPISRQDE